jgi:hypothetical protein
VGCWCNLDNLELYLQEANEIAQEQMRNNKAKDPVFDFWIFDSDTQWDAVTSK